MTPNPLGIAGFGGGLAFALLALTMAALSSHHPLLIWFQSLQMTLYLSSVLCFLAAILAAIVFRHETRNVAQVGVTIVVAALMYLGVQGISNHVTESAYRAALATSARWAIALRPNYSKLSPGVINAGNKEAQAIDGAPTPPRFTYEYYRRDKNRLILTLPSTSDETDLTSADLVHTPSVSDFLVRAQLSYVQGPPDGGCTIIFGFTKSEHWWDVRIGGDNTLAVTQDFGQESHRYISQVSMGLLGGIGRTEAIAVFYHDSTLDVFVDKIRLIHLQEETIPTGEVWIGPQARNTPDQVTCSYSTFQLTGPSSA
jgi:hypothetical protein